MLYSAYDKQRFCEDLKILSGNIHDGICVYFRYDRVKQEIDLCTDSGYFKTKCHMTFYNVKLFFSTNFGIWGGSEEAINCIVEINSDSINRSLSFLETVKSDGGHTPLNIDKLLGIHLLFLTGNEVFILCEYVSIEPDAIAISRCEYADLERRQRAKENLQRLGQNGDGNKDSHNLGM